MRTAKPEDHKYAEEITTAMAESATKRGVNIARRPVDYINKKIDEGLAVIAFNPANGSWVGFGCIEVWKHERFVANSGLIVSPEYRGFGVSSDIKIKMFELGRQRFPVAKHFSLTTNPGVIHTNQKLGFKTVSFEEIMSDNLFLIGATSWIDYVDLMCTAHHSNYVAMIFEPECLIHESTQNVHDLEKKTILSPAV